MKFLTWQHSEQLIVAQNVINNVKLKNCGIKVCLVFAKTGLEALKKRVLSAIDDLVGVLPSPQVSWGWIN